MNKFNIIIFGCIVVAFILLNSCAKETETIDESTFGYDFFPIVSGKTWTYVSDSIVYSNGGSNRDTLRSFLREDVGESFLDEEGKTNYKLIRYFKRNEADVWTRTNTWTTSMDKSRAIRTEENIKFVKLVFPVKKGLRFDGNIFVDEDIKISVGGETIEAYKNWKHRIEEINEDYSFKDQKIQALRINLVDENSIIDRRKVTEYYGKGIGLLKKEMFIFDGDGSRPNDAWESKAQKGFKHTLTLIDVK